MNAKNFSDGLNELDNKYIEEAVNYKKKAKQPIWMKWGTLAACFAVVALIGAGVLHGGFSGNKTDIALLDGGEKLEFVKSNITDSALALDLYVFSRPLTDEEIKAVFADLPVMANALFSGQNQKLIGFEGKIGKIKMVVATSDVPVMDTKIDGTEESSEINGTSVTAGYSITDPNSKGEQTAIYYAAFKLGDCTVYVENAGAKADSESVKNELAETVQELIDHGSFNLNSITR